MQVARVNKETGRMELVDVSADPSNSSAAVAAPPIEDEKVPTTYLELLENRAKRQAARAEREIENELAANASGIDDRPMFADSIGMALSDTAKIAANAGTAVVTDAVDLGLGVFDVVGQTAQLLTGQRDSYNPDELFNDSDNPLTRLRREAFKTESKMGQTVSNFVRLGTALLTFPKLGIKALKIAPTIGKAIPGVKGVATKTLKGIDKVDDALKASTAPKVTKAMEGLKDVATSAGGKKAAARVAKNDWLTYTYQDIAKSAEATNWWKGVSNSAAALTSINKVKGTKAKIRTVAEAIGWDAFVAFNVFGEGQDDFDETLTDFLAEIGVSRLGFLETSVLDSSLERKTKQMLEGLVTAVPMAAVIDMIRIRRFAKAFNSANDADKRLILEAFNAEADELGRGIYRLVPDPDEAGKGFSQVPATSQAAQGPMRPGWDPSMDPWTGGALARLNSQFDAVNAADRNVTNAAAIRALADGPVYGPFAAGLIGESPQNVDAQIAAVRAGQAPVPAWGGQAIPDGRVRSPGVGLIGESPQAVNAQIAATRAGQAPVPAFGDGQVIGKQPFPPATTGVTAIGPSSPVRGKPAPIPEWERTGPSSPIPGKPAPVPEWEKTGPSSPIPGKPASVPEGLTPRNPEPVVSPKALKAAFDEDAASVFREAVVLGADDLVPAQLKKISDEVEALVPKTRVDAIDYIRNNPITANELGVIEASQSIWSNFIINRGLFEGWARIGEDMQVRFLRNAAADLDRGELAERSAKALDEAVDNELFNENLGRLIVETNEAAAKGADPIDARLKGDAITAKTEEERFELGEEARLSEAGQAALDDKLSDEEVVRQFLGQDLNAIQGPDVEKVEGSRGWVLLSEDGEQLGRYTRKSQALKAAEREAKSIRQKAVDKARQIEADGIEQVLQEGDANPIYTSDLKTKVKLTKAQVDELLRYSDPVRKQIRVSKNTYEFTQRELYDLIDGLTALKQTGEMKGNRLRVINNLIDKFDTQMKLLAPQARAISNAEFMASEASRFLKNGEFC